MRKRDVATEGCSVCKKIKPPKAFSKKRGVRNTTCKECAREYSKTYRKENAERIKSKKAHYYKVNKDKIRSARLEAEYGLPPGSYEKMLEEQNGKCAICETKECGGGKGYFCVDHNHATGQVRKLLCSACNKLIGFAKEDPEILRKAGAYLERENQRGVC